MATLPVRLNCFHRSIFHPPSASELAIVSFGVPIWSLITIRNFLGIILGRIPHLLSEDEAHLTMMACRRRHLKQIFELALHIVWICRDYRLRRIIPDLFALVVRHCGFQCILVCLISIGGFRLLKLKATGPWIIGGVVGGGPLVSGISAESTPAWSYSVLMSSSEMPESGKTRGRLSFVKPRPLKLQSLLVASYCRSAFLYASLLASRGGSPFLRQVPFQGAVLGWDVTEAQFLHEIYDYTKSAVSAHRLCGRGVGYILVAEVAKASAREGCQQRLDSYETECLGVISQACVCHELILHVSGATSGLGLKNC